MGNVSRWGGALLMLWATMGTAAQGTSHSHLEEAAVSESARQNSVNQSSVNHASVNQKSINQDPVNHGESPSQESAGRRELEAQVVAWNRGDLKGYMRGYWHSPELTFFAGGKESAGWEAAYQRYRTAYLGNDKQMGKLNFTHLRVQVLSPDSAFVRGGWQLTMKDGSKRAGLFTVVLRKFPEGWRIIHDHSS